MDLLQEDKSKLHTKPSILALIDKFEKLCQPSPPR